jgi:hypothetical protein
MQGKGKGGRNHADKAYCPVETAHVIQQFQVLKVGEATVRLCLSLLQTWATKYQDCKDVRLDWPCCWVNIDDGQSVWTPRSTHTLCFLILQSFYVIATYTFVFSVFLHVIELMLITLTFAAKSPTIGMSLVHSLQLSK